MNAPISRLVVPAEAEINNANSHGEPYNVKLSHFCVFGNHYLTIETIEAPNVVLILGMVFTSVAYTS